jgi:DedD protein
MRDLERWKDKVELSLDGRQIFFLFFGSAVAACLLFVSGMMVGKRIERRAMAATTQTAAEDPLAALDQLGAADDDDGLTFHQTLAAADHRAKHEGAKAEAAKADAAKPEAAKVEAAKLAPRPEAERPAKPDAQKPAAVKPGKPDGKPSKPDVAANAKGKPGRPDGAKPDGAKPDGKAAQKPDGKGERFTLQLSAFPDRGEAEAFLKKMQAAGYKPLIVQSDVPGRGVYYRVRVGDFASRKAAADARTEFERKQHLSAYVAKM